MMKYNECMLAALLLRVSLVVWGYFQDAWLGVKYTDVDYQVFTDAARFVVEGGSPYQRPTYRYTPLLAWLLTPNIVVDARFGKLLFCLVDVLNGAIIYRQVLAVAGERRALIGCCLWLFNPITCVVSTRGNAETLVTLLVLVALDLHRRRRYAASGFWLGLAVHFKIYPVIYCPVFYFSAGHHASPDRDPPTLWRSLKPTQRRCALVGGVAAALALTTALGYVLYGWPFLHETYLHHVTRRDARHNFSPYFYLLYLTSESTATWMSLAAFAPQAAAVLILSWRFRAGDDLALGLFLLTYAFVTFNKVVTSQYFMWYISWLPLCAHRLNFGASTGRAMAAAWFGAQGLWLAAAYLLEFCSWNVFVHVWLASLLFFSVNVFIMCRCLGVQRLKTA